MRSPAVERLRSRLARRLARPELSALESELAGLRQLDGGQYPPGHYYSPVPSADDVAAAVATEPRRELPGIDIDLDAMVARAERFQALIGSAPTAGAGARYQAGNGFFGALDAFALEGFLAEMAPARVVEVGSGWSSALMLDVADRRPELKAEFTFIDPDPVRLDALLRPADEQRTTVIRTRVQDVDRAVFSALQAGDILFIDSSHVVKVGSDVNLLLLDVVPTLPAGVVVHVHDIFAGFDYPAVWLSEGRYWSEGYLLRALLTHSPRYRVLWFGDLVGPRLPDGFPEADGASIWFEIT